MSNKRILITGSTNGLGKAMANALYSKGHKVFVSGKNENAVKETLSEIRNHFPQSNSKNIQGKVIDVRSSESIENGLQEMLSHYGGIDVLINNAGIGMRTVNPLFLSKPMPFWEVPEDKFKNLIDTNFTGYFLCSKIVVPHLLKNKDKGSVINISMNHETMKRAGFVPYGPSRMAIESLSHIMAEDLKPFNVSVNLLLPGGATATGMIPDEVPDNIKKILLPVNCMDEAVVWMVSDESKGVTNERIVAKDFKTWLSSRLGR